MAIAMAGVTASATGELWYFRDYPRPSVPYTPAVVKFTIQFGGFYRVAAIQIRWLLTAKVRQWAWLLRSRAGLWEWEAVVNEGDDASLEKHWFLPFEADSLRLEIRDVQELSGVRYYGLSEIQVYGYHIAEYEQCSTICSHGGSCINTLDTCTCVDKWQWRGTTCTTDCSGALTGCPDLNRDQCFSTDESCGSCVAGFIVPAVGSGPGNDRCVRESDIEVPTVIAASVAPVEDIVSHQTLDQSTADDGFELSSITHVGVLIGLLSGLAIAVIVFVCIYRRAKKNKTVAPEDDLGETGELDDDEYDGEYSDEGEEEEAEEEQSFDWGHLHAHKKAKEKYRSQFAAADGNGRQSSSPAAYSPDEGAVWTRYVDEEVRSFLTAVAALYLQQTAID